MPSSSWPVDSRDALAAPFYALAALLIGIPLLDFLQSVGVPQLGNLQWRFATVGLLSSLLLTPMLGLAVAATVAARQGHLVVLRILALLNVIASITLLLLTVGFALDVLQLRNVVPDQARGEFRVASVKALIKHVSAAVILGFFGVREWRISAWRSQPRERAPIPLVSR